MCIRSFKDYRIQKAKAKGDVVRPGNISSSNTTESTNSGGGAVGATAVGMADPNRGTLGHHHHHRSSSNPILKQRAYLSKGVPVILYEEMSDKPLEDYDENNTDSIGTGAGTGTTSRLIGNYFRYRIIRENFYLGCLSEANTKFHIYFRIFSLRRLKFQF